MNSWGRDVLLFSDAVTGAPTTTRDYDVVEQNLFFANYHSLGAVDNDDGSSYYKVRGNVFLYGDGGQKADFEGHDDEATDNFYAWIRYVSHNGYGSVIGTPGKGVLEGHEHVCTGNTAVLTSDGAYALPICSGAGKTVMGNNTLFTPSGNVTECGMPLAAWQAAGNDAGTVAHAYADTSAGALVALARSKVMVPTASEAALGAVARAVA
jgi:hypothetical protein